jgi:hypothetical protein
MFRCARSWRPLSNVFYGKPLAGEAKVIDDQTMWKGMGG